MSAVAACPLCGQALYPWVTPTDGDRRGRFLDRCENCGAAVERAAGVDPVRELDAISIVEPDGARWAQLPNRGSLQAGIGGEAWAAIDAGEGSLIHTPRSLAFLAERTGYEVESLSFGILARNQAWMWQTLLNGITLHPNFAREAMAGRLRPSTGRGRIAFTVDFVASVLAAPFVALVSVPIELIAVALRRGGLIRAKLTPVSSHPDPTAASA
jgi:hypothetical protein